MRPATGIRILPAGKKGRGVFATRRFFPGDVIERAPIILIADQSDEDAIGGTIVSNYWYETETGDGAIGLGFTSLYNHRSRANAVYEVSSQSQAVTILAYRQIEPGDEITINYNGDPDDRTKIRFANGRRVIDDEDGAPDASSYFVHYAESNAWGSDGWVWCGACDVPSTRVPDQVTCHACRHRMAAERQALSSWSPQTVKEPELTDLLDLASVALQGQGMVFLAESVRLAVDVLRRNQQAGTK